MNSGQAHAVLGVISGKPCKIAQKMEAFSSGREAEGSEMHKVATNWEKVVGGQTHTTHRHPPSSQTHLAANPCYTQICQRTV